MFFADIKSLFQWFDPAKRHKKEIILRKTIKKLSVYQIKIQIFK